MEEAKARRAASAEYVLRPPSDPRTANMRRRVTRANRFNASGDTTATDQSDLDNGPAPPKSGRQSRQDGAEESDPEHDLNAGANAAGGSPSLRAMVDDNEEEGGEGWSAKKDPQVEVDDQGMPYDYVEYGEAEGAGRSAEAYQHGYLGDDSILRKSPRTSASSYSARHQRDAMDALSLGPTADLTGLPSSAKIKTLGKRRGPSAAAWRKKVQQEDLDSKQRVAVYCMSSEVDLKEVLTKLNALEAAAASTAGLNAGLNTGSNAPGTTTGSTAASPRAASPTAASPTAEPAPTTAFETMAAAGASTPTPTSASASASASASTFTSADDAVQWSNVVFDEAVHSTTSEFALH